jgi:alpha-tubulin suppressor-like RCC1 family protein
MREPDGLIPIARAYRDFPERATPETPSLPVHAASVAALVPLQDIKQVATGGEHTCVLTTAGGVKCWGRNEYGQLGNGTVTDAPTAVDVVGLTGGVAYITAGTSHTCALTTVGGVKCWGLNDSGQLGDGSTATKTAPVSVSGLASNVAAISATGWHSCALMDTGGVKCWGSNGWGQLGDGTTVNRTTAVNVSGLTSGGVVISAGRYHTCAITVAGGVKCWGYNDVGQLGDGTVADRYTPTDVIGLTTGTTAVSVGRYHTCARTAGGGVKCWGDNRAGQLGDGTMMTKLIPTAVVGMTTGISAVSSGRDHTCALTAGGGIKCWGDNYYGQLGDGTTTLKPIPADVIGLGSSILSVSGSWHTCALADAGSVKCWGNNGDGQLGDGGTTNTSIPGNVLTGQCYMLTRRHIGSGSDPTANPQRSLTCPTGYYTGGVSVMLTASPAAGWRVAGWSGTTNNASNATTNSLTMPLRDAEVSVTYVRVATLTPTATVTQTPSPTPALVADPYEPDDTCALARFIPADGTTQDHTFHRANDQDWVAFQAIANQRYLILGDVGTTSRADLVLIPFRACDAVPDPGQDYSFSAGVRLEFRAATTGPVYLKLMNHSPSVGGSDVSYTISVRALQENAESGALILVAGRIREDDPLQGRIYAVTDAVYRLFLAHGYTADRIFYLAPDFRSGVDSAVSAESLRAAITSWARDKVGADQPLTLYLMDHGARERFYLDRPRGESVAPADLDAWLAQIEALHPGLRVNVILEACYAGSFIDPPQQISRAGRVVIASTGATSVAYASPGGAIFSDHLLAALDQGDSLYGSFRKARGAVSAAYLDQTPWLDDNGNGIPNEPADGAEAQRRGFSFAGTLADEQWPPYIAEFDTPAAIQNASGEIRARVLDDPDSTVRRVWIVVYPPSYRPPDAAEELVSESLPGAVLQDRGGGWYGVTYTGFNEPGAYRVVIYAEDSDGLQAQPVSRWIGGGGNIYLPLVLR